MKQKTNVQLVKSMMEYSNYGALAQMFIIDAIRQKADAVAKADLAELEKHMGGPNAMVSPRSWIGVAKEIQQKMIENYEGNALKG